jgi:hypothetical protein
MAGWIKLWRAIEEDPMYLSMTSKQRDVLLQVLLMANHQEKSWIYDGKLYHCKPGQFVTSLDQIQERCAKDVSIQNIRTAISIMESYQFLTNKSTNKNRLITICNWEKYQGELTSNLTGNQQATNKQSAYLQQVQTTEINKQLTSNLTGNQQANQQLTRRIKNKEYIYKEKENKEKERPEQKEQELTPDQVSFLASVLSAYNTAHFTSRKAIKPETRRNILKWLDYYDPDKIILAVEKQKRCESPFLRELSFETLFRHSDTKGNDVDYIGQILANYKIR